MTLIWAPEALQDLAEIRGYIAEHNPTAAIRVVRRIVDLVSTQLPQSPNSGRIGRVAGTRELVVSKTPFVVPYRIGSDGIEVLRVLHAARAWPSDF